MLALVVTLLLFCSLGESDPAGSASTTDSGSGELTPITEEEAVCPTKTKTLHLVAMAPFPNPIRELSPGWAGGPAVIPGSQLAVKHINSRCDILEGFKLELLVANSGCDVITKVHEGFFKELFGKSGSNQVIGIVGPGCSDSTIHLASLIAYNGVSLINIAPSATSPLLVNKTKYPNTFRPIPSNLGYIQMYLELIRQKNYKGVAILYEAERLVHVTTETRFQKSLKENNISARSYGLFDSQIPLIEIKNTHRIIFVFGGASISRKLMCLAKHENMIHDDYQFIFSERRLDHFKVNVSFSLNKIDYKCSKEDMLKAVTGILLSGIRLIREDKETPLISGMDYNQFEKEYKVMLNAYKNQLNLSKVVETQHQSGYYDSTWAFALSFNASMQNSNFSLDNYKYGHHEMTNIIREEMLKVNFQGVRGTVHFNSTTLDGEGVTVLEMFQIMHEKPRLIGVFDPRREARKQLNLSDESLLIEQSHFNLVSVSSPTYVVAIMFTILVAMTIITVTFHVANTKWIRFMKATSPALNHIIFSGCYLYLLSVLFLTIQEEIKRGLNFNDTHSNLYVYYGVFCSAVIWCESIAPTLILGTICAKTWRVYRIFSHSSASFIKHLEDFRLVLFICVLLVVDTIFNITWNLVNPWSAAKAEQQELSVGIVCRCDKVLIWSLCLACQKALLLLVVVYLSILTRRIPKREYKQTKYTNALVYILMFIGSIAIPVYLILYGSTKIHLATVSYLALSIKGIASVAVCTVLIFLPPLKLIFKAKWKAHRFESETMTQTLSVTHSFSVNHK